MTETVLDDPMLDEEWLAAPVKRSRLRTVLVVTLAAAVCVLGGATIQQHFGESATAGAAAGPGGFPGGQLPAGLPEGGFPGGLSGTSDGDSESAAGADETESVIGELVEVRGEIWIVQDLGGKRHRIQVGDDTDVVRETRIQLTEVSEGDLVDVSGAADNDRLQATEVTLR